METEGKPEEKHTAIIGDKAYEMQPLNSLQIKTILEDIIDILQKQGPDLGLIIATLVESGKLDNWISTVTGVPAVEIRARITRNQIKHFIGEFWRQNFYKRLDEWAWSKESKPLPS